MSNAMDTVPQRPRNIAPVLGRPRLTFGIEAQAPGRDVRAPSSVDR
jgi:hypothetical protein